MKFKTILFSAVLLLGSLAACSELNEFSDVDDVSSDRELAVPLASADLAMSDVLGGVEDDISLFVDNDGVLHFKYSGDVLTKNADDVFDAINAALSVGGIVPLVANDVTLPFQFPDGLDLDRMDLKEGNFYYNVSSNPNNFPVTVHIEAPNFTKDGQSLTYDFEIPANYTLPSTNLAAPTDLEGYSITPSTDNELHILSSFTDPDGNEVTVTEPGIAISNLAFSYAEGYMGQQTYDESRDTIYIDFFNNWINGDIYFEDPEITINFENSFGIPTRSVVNVFEVFTVHQDVLPLESSFIDEGIDFPFPAFNEIGQTKYKTFTFNTENSNIAEILGAGPLALDYDVDAFTNPDNDASIIGFATDTSYYKVRIDIDLPLYARANQFTALDTLEVDLDTESLEEAKEAELKLITENGIPLEIGLQGYFLSDDNTVLDSLFANDHLITQAAPVDSQGFPTGDKAEKVTYIPLNKEQLDKINGAKKMVLKGIFSTENQGTTSVRITNKADIGIRMGIKFKL